MTDAFRVYDVAGADGYPVEWHQTIKHLVRAQADHRCVRCCHPYRTGGHAMVELDEERGVYVSWSPCDGRCTHRGPIRVKVFGDWDYPPNESLPAHDAEGGLQHALSEWPVEAAWRILTVHHLNMNKLDCRWWNLASLCQRCHLNVQLRVVLDRPYDRPHREWFKPYAAGWYAWRYLGEELTREQAEARLDDLLALELRQEALFA